VETHTAGPGCHPGHKDIVELLIAKGAPLNLRDKRGYTPLLNAVSRGYRDIAQLLLAKGAAIDEKDPMGSTPLILAALDGQKDIVELLISKGANVNTINSRGSTPVGVAARRGTWRSLNCSSPKEQIKNISSKLSWKVNTWDRKNPA